MFTERNGGYHLERIALNMSQIEEVKPPENPAKPTDARFKKYRQRFGNSSWELDALPPSYLNNLVETNITKMIDDDLWQKQVDRISEYRRQISKIADQFEEE
jgi:hypothetical protein